MSGKSGGIKRKVGLSTSWSPGYDADFDQDDFPPPARTVRVSDLIRNLQLVLERNGDVPLCISDTNYMSPIDENSLRLKIVNSNEYNFTIGLESPQYLSVFLK